MKISNLAIKPSTGKIDSQFVGIKIKENNIEFHYPETYDLSNDEEGLRKDIVAILRSVGLAKTFTSDKSSYNQNHKDEYAFPLKSFLWIINDYLTYGKYENLEKKFQEGIKGKINWKRTMSSNPAFFNGNVVYTNIISEKQNQTDNLLTEIYFFCVQKSIDSIGWLYNLKFNNNGIDYYKLFNEKKYLNTINTELSHSFMDTKKIRLNHMKNIITGLDDSMLETNELIFGVDSYEHVFEKMIDTMFSRVDNKNEFYPNATWDLVVENNIKDSSNLRPDTILIDKKTNNVYIIDAKYYRYGQTFNSNHLPETTSIQKQITYGEYIKKVKVGKYNNVYNAFLMPYSKTRNVHADTFNKDIEFVGIGSAKWIETNESNRKIAAILIDTKFLINNWIKCSDQIVDELITLINEKVGE